MKIGLITDTHAGARGDSLIFQDYFEKFFNELFFPTIEQQKITHIIHLGDWGDRRKFINYNILYRTRNAFFDPLEKMGITMDLILGNHDLFFKNTSEVNSAKELLGRYKNIKIYEEVTEVKLGEMNVLYIPWINSDNQERALKKIQETKCKVAFGHLELMGFEMYRGVKNDSGMDPKIFKKFSQVFTGHYHHKSDNGKIFYLGAPYEMTFADMNDPKGFHIYNTSTEACKFVQNPFRMFHRIYYDDRGKDLKEIINPKKLEKYAGTQLKIVVTHKTNPFYFDQFLDAIQKIQPADFKIVEDLKSTLTEDDVNMAEDTLTILYKYVDGMDLDVDKQRIKDHLHQLYIEAQTMDRETES